MRPKITLHHSSCSKEFPLGATFVRRQKLDNTSYEMYKNAGNESYVESIELVSVCCALSTIEIFHESIQVKIIFLTNRDSTEIGDESIIQWSNVYAMRYFGSV